MYDIFIEECDQYSCYYSDVSVCVFCNGSSVVYGKSTSLDLL